MDEEPRGECCGPHVQQRIRVSCPVGRSGFKVCGMAGDHGAPLARQPRAREVFPGGLRPIKERGESGEERFWAGALGEVGAEPGVRRCPPSSHAERGRAVGCRRAPARGGVGWGCERRSRPASGVDEGDELLRMGKQRADKPGGSSPRGGSFALPSAPSRSHPGSVDRMSFRGRGGTRAAGPRASR